MKKITTLLLSISTVIASAQTNSATPNANFEHWTQHSGYSDPNQWNDLNSTTSTFGFYTCIQDSTPADVRSGKYAVRLLTTSYIGQLIPGTVTTGTINTTNQTISGGLPYTLRPDSIIGWYKYTSVSGDNGDIEFYLFDASSDTIGEAFFKTPKSTVSTYTRMSLVISYRSSNAVATALWILTSSINQTAGKVGSELYADSLGLKFDTATGIAPITNNTNITVGPNPANTFITVNNASNIQSPIFTIYDITGRKVLEIRMVGGINSISTDGLTNGIYLYSVTGENSALKSGKIVIQK